MNKQTDIINPANVISHTRFEIPGGIHPPEHKSISNQSKIAYLAPAKELILPISKQHGIEGQRLVDVGENVSAGQKLFDTAISQIATNTHSPYDGEVLAVADKNLGHASGLLMPTINIKPTSNKYLSPLQPVDKWWQAEPADLIDRIHEAGIVGMGGAAFPTHIKLKKSAKSIETLIVNGMECEPYITCDDRLLREHSWEIFQGALITAKIVDAKQILFGIEDNKPEAIEVLTQQVDRYLQQNIDSNIPSPKIQIIVAKTKYPSGGEKQLIQLLTGLQVPQNQYPAALGLLVQNIATLFAINDAVCNGQTLTHRVVTVTGDLVNKPGNYWVAFGTPLTHIVSELQIDAKQLSKIILGGPLMGQAISDLNIPTQKSTNCIIFNSEKADRLTVSPNNFHEPCIRCGECEKVCPASLLPQQLYWFAQSEQWEKLEQQNLFDCIECGACSYVCPSEIPLVNYYRFSKSEIKHLKSKQKKSEIAKLRIENREKRIKRLKAEREAKRKKTAEARKLAASNQNKDPDGKQSAIEAALLRVKNKKEEQT